MWFHKRASAPTGDGILRCSSQGTALLRSLSGEVGAGVSLLVPDPSPGRRSRFDAFVSLHPGRGRACAQSGPSRIDRRGPAVTDRAVSHFEWRRVRGAEECKTIAEAVKLEIDGLRTPENSLGCYLAHSRHEVGLADWIHHFGSSSVCVLIAEKLFANDADELSRLHESLGRSTTNRFPVSNVGTAGARPAVLPSAMFDATTDEVGRLIGRSTDW